jgi:hypothetical protein
MRCLIERRALVAGGRKGVAIPIDPNPGASAPTSKGEDLIKYDLVETSNRLPISFEPGRLRSYGVLNVGDLDRVFSNMMKGKG